MNTGIQASANSYTYWSAPHSGYLQIVVMNNGVDFAVGKTLGAGGPEAADFPPLDEFLPPGTMLRPDMFDAIRIKSHAPNQSAQYSISTRLSSDLPVGKPLGASFTPGYANLNSDGTVTPVFNGGVILTAPTPPIGQSLSSAITWEDASGALIARITGASNPPTPGEVLTLEALASEGLDTTSATLRAGDNGYVGAGQQTSNVVTARGRDGSGDSLTSVTAGAISAAGVARSAKIIDAANSSQFIRKVGFDTTDQIQYGLASLPWNGVATTITVAVAFGRTYTGISLVLLTPASSSNGRALPVSYEALSVNGMTIRGEVPAGTPPAAPSSVGWAILGTP